MTGDGVLEDGTYDALVVDAAPDPDGSCRVDLTLLDGAHKGEVVSFRTRGLGDEALDLLGVPATLVVEGGSPTVTFEP
jgi:hypothetical protein